MNAPFPKNRTPIDTRVERHGVGLLAAEGSLLETIATRGHLTGTADEIAVTLGISQATLDTCLRTLSAARWITVHREPSGLLTVYLAR